MFLVTIVFLASIIFVAGIVFLIVKLVSKIKKSDWQIKKYPKRTKCKNRKISCYNDFRKNGKEKFSGWLQIHSEKKGGSKYIPYNVIN